MLFMPFLSFESFVPLRLVCLVLMATLSLISCNKGRHSEKSQVIKVELYNSFEQLGSSVVQMELNSSECLDVEKQWLQKSKKKSLVYVEYNCYLKVYFRGKDPTLFAVCVKNGNPLIMRKLPEKGIPLKRLLTILSRVYVVESYSVESERLKAKIMNELDDVKL